MESYDLAVIGAGPGGYVAAIRAAQLGKKVALVEKENLGGACLNTGCIPSKSLLEHGKLVQEIRKANEWGIQTGELSIDFLKLMKRKDRVVETLRNGIGYLLRKNRIELIRGTASVGANLVISAGDRTFRAEDVILATGGKPFVPAIPGLEQIDYLTTDSFFALQTLPDKLVIIGGGVIAVEIAFAMAPLGTDVTILEVADDILTTEDRDAREIIKKRLDKLGVQVVPKASVTNVSEKVVVAGEETYPFDRILVAAGRSPNLEIARELGLELDESGRYVKVDEFYRTSRPHIYAIGDLIGGYQLAHSASAEGLVAARTIAGEGPQPLDSASIPRCVYTQPEIGSFGLSEQEAKALGYQVRVKISQLSGNGKSLAMGDAEGFVKLISDSAHGEILGAVVVAPNATEMIQEVLAVKGSEGTMHELAGFVRAHPSVSEAIGESAEAFFELAIHQ